MVSTTCIQPLALAALAAAPRSASIEPPSMPFGKTCSIVLFWIALDRAGSDTSSACWQESGGYTFERCCRILDEEGQGDPRCWSADFTYETCCWPEFQRHFDHGRGLIDSGNFRQAADYLFDIFSRFLSVKSGPAVQSARMALPLLEKAVAGYQKSLKALPRTLSHFEVLFVGLGIDCKAPGDEENTVAQASNMHSLYSDYERCCPNGFFGGEACNKVFYMMAAALGLRHRGDPAAQDAYFSDFSEHWCCHHFTPSMFGDGTVEVDVRPQAYGIDRDIASILDGDGEPTLGIVFREHFGTYVSGKFTNGVLLLTVLLWHLREVSPDSIVDIFEIGAGYGALPRMLASANWGLRKMSRPMDIRSYSIFDIRSSIDLQRWYLNKTVTNLVDPLDWKMESRGWGSPGLEGLLSVWPGVGDPSTCDAAASAALRVNFVDPDHRDLFAHILREARNFEEHKASTQQDSPAASSKTKSTSVLLAVNSWHEFTVGEFFWYYNAFIAAPLWSSGAEWLLYVENYHWEASAAKHRLLSQAQSQFGLELCFELCNKLSCVRLFRRRESKGSCKLGLVLQSA